nr:PREDICTED: uncharacterized protein LOC107826004 [Nicotiana tabacum]
MLNTRQEVEHEIRWEMKSEITNVWHEKWTGLGALYHVVPPDFQINEEMEQVNELRQEDGWDEELIDHTFPEEIVDHIKQQVLFEGSDGFWDRPWWKPTSSGRITVSSAWQLVRHRENQNPKFKNLWIKGLQFKISFFLWRLWRLKLITDDIWKRQGYIYMSRCWCCQNPQEESFDHLFLTGTTATRVWRTFLGAAGITVPLIQVKNIIRAWWNADYIITYLEAYKPIIVTKRVAWQFPYNGWYMCNTCGASRDNPSPSATGFCVRDSVGDLVYARAQQLEETTNIVVEAKAIRDGLHYYMEHDLHPLILETDSPGIKKIIEGEWDPPWCIMAEVNRIKQMKEEFNVIFQHV